MQSIESIKSEVPFKLVGTLLLVILGAILTLRTTAYAGYVITRDVPDGCLAAGVPAVVKRRLVPGVPAAPLG